VLKASTTENAAKDYNRRFGIIRHNSPKVAANDLYTYESKLILRIIDSTIFKATTIFIATSLHIVSMKTSCLQFTLQYSILEYVSV